MRNGVGGCGGVGSLALAIALGSVAALAGDTSAQKPAPAPTASPASASAKPEPHFPKLGSYRRKITTTSPVAQEYFDQGLDFLYGFNHDEAIRSFEAAAAADPHCAMAYWGVAAANGPHINSPNVDEDHAKAAWKATRQGPRVGVRRVAHRAGSDRSDGQALRREAAVRSPSARRRVCRRDAKGLGRTPGRCRRRRPHGRGTDGSATVGSVDVHRQTAAGH